MPESLEQFLASTQRDASYRVDAVLKETPFETTERVFFVGATGGEQGPYIRKRITAPTGSSLGSAYQRIFDAQQEGRRFHRLPRIVSCYTAGNQVTVVMEYVFGETLLHARHQRSLDAGLTFDRVCSAVRELHEQFDPPIIHRDLKPSNIMVSKDDVALIDFGIARSYNSETENDTTQFGTRTYAPPEQFGFSQTDERSDVYALGLILFFLATGQEPTVANRSAHYFHPDLAESLRGIVNRATALDPDQRFATVKDLQKAAAFAFEQACPQPAVQEAAATPASSTNPSWKNPLPDNRSRGRKVWGAVRNAIATVVWLLFFAIVVSCTVDPSVSDQTAAFPAWLRALLYGSFFFVPATCACYALADKTPLRRRIPFFLRIKGKTEILALVIVALASFTLFLFAIAAVSPMMPPVSK